MKRNLTYRFLIALVVLAGAVCAAAQDDSRFAKLDGNKIHYKSYGGSSRDAIVLVHGWGCNLDHWRDQIPELSKRARVIALDLPGHGLSDKPDISYTMDLFAAAIEAVMKDAKVERAVLVGHSMGTPVVRQFYRKYPKQTLGIVIVDGGLRPFADKAHRDQFIDMFRGPNYKEAGAQMFTAMTATMAEADRERVKTSFSSTPQKVLVSAMESMNEDALYTTDKINVPVLAILAKSPYWPADTEQFFRSLAPDLTYVMWEGVGHFLMIERPKEFNAAVIAFLDKKALLK